MTPPPVFTPQNDWPRYRASGVHCSFSPATYLLNHTAAELRAAGFRLAKYIPDEARYCDGFGDYGFYHDRGMDYAGEET